MLILKDGFWMDFSINIARNPVISTKHWHFLLLMSLRSCTKIKKRFSASIVAIQKNNISVNTW